MAIKLRIPEKRIPILKRILELDEKKKKILLDRFKSFKIKIESIENLEKIAPVENFDDFSLIFKELLSIFKLYQNLHSDRLVEDIDDFIHQFTRSLVEEYKLIQEHIIEDFDNKVQLMGEFFSEIFTSNKYLYYIEKAKKLLIERAKLIGNTRIITDIRPIFKEEKIGKPEYSLIIHNLRIEYTKDFKNMERSFFALDHQDLIKLQEQIKRALDKEEEMQEICKKMGLKNLGEEIWNQ